MATKNYTTERNQLYLKKTRDILKEMPSFCFEFFQGISDITTPLTQYGYALDLRTFFRFLCNDSSATGFLGRDISDIQLQDINTLRTADIEEFLSYITLYESEQKKSQKNRTLENHDRAKLRKLSCIRALFKFFTKREKLDKNVAAIVSAPKLREKPILRLEANETADLLDEVEKGQGLTSHQKHYHKQTQVRDLTIVMLFLSTGIRISELVGLNCSDINFSINGFRVTRKGGAQVILYFNEETADILQEYMQQREEIDALDGHEEALFLSIQKRRLTPRAVQNLVKKYTKTSVPLKNISPHKLRSTFGTMLYQETGDIYLVADVLGHRDVNTTKKHYAEQSDQNRRHAAKVIHLRDEAKRDKV